MGFISDKHLEAMRTGVYPCEKCDGFMEFEDEYEETLICKKCGYEVDVDMYGHDPNENLYPTKDEITDEYDDESDDSYGETYDEVYDELDDSE